MTDSIRTFSDYSPHYARVRYVSADAGKPLKMTMQFPVDSTHTFTDSSRWSAYTAQSALHPQEQRHDMQVAITVLDMIITIAPVVLLAGIWSKLNEVLVELRRSPIEGVWRGRGGQVKKP